MKNNLFTEIPPITDLLGASWEQPARENLLIDDESVLMSKKDFELLLEYSTSIPSGKYLGKMWKLERKGKWFLCWYDVDPEPRYLAIPHRVIILV